MTCKGLGTSGEGFRIKRLGFSIKMIPRGSWKRVEGPQGKTTSLEREPRSLRKMWLLV